MQSLLLDSLHSVAKASRTSTSIHSPRISSSPPNKSENVHLSLDPNFSPLLPCSPPSTHRPSSSRFRVELKPFIPSHPLKTKVTPSGLPNLIAKLPSLSTSTSDAGQKFFTPSQVSTRYFSQMSDSRTDNNRNNMKRKTTEREKLKPQKPRLSKTPTVTFERDSDHNLKVNDKFMAERAVDSLPRPKPFPKNSFSPRNISKISSKKAKSGSVKASSSTLSNLPQFPKYSDSHLSESLPTPIRYQFVPGKVSKTSETHSEPSTRENSLIFSRINLILNTI
ncbi:hypothetical protein GEMRC1_003801 [Eukaryota sp. GEM-RC1]